MGNCLLINQTYDKTPVFPWKNKTIKAKVIKVYDGDTIWIVTRLGFQYIRFKIRLSGIDSAEMKTSSATTKGAKLVKKAHLARDKLQELILNKIIIVHCKGPDKWGRMLGDLYLESGTLCCYNKIHINQWMLDNKYAVKYDGGKKPSEHVIVNLT